MINKLENKFGHLAIPELMKYIALLNALVAMLNFLGFDAYRALILSPRLVMQGQVWRLITYIFIPPTNSVIFMFFVIMFYYFIGTSLEYHWGTFKFNLFYFIGVIATTFVSFFTGGYATATSINLSMFLAFATLYPDFELRLYFILPLKVKYLAFFYWLIILYQLLTYPISEKFVVLVSLLNYLIFFYGDIKEHFTLETKRYDAKQNRRDFKVIRPKEFTYHKCHACGITEKDDPDMEFRYCSSCDGHYEYCMNHLKDHEHVKENN